MFERPDTHRDPPERAGRRLWNWGILQISAIVTALVVLIIWAYIGHWFDSSASPPATSTTGAAHAARPSSPPSGSPPQTVTSKCAAITVVGTDVPVHKNTAPVQVRTGGGCAPVYAAATPAARLIAHLPDRTRVHILCTERGPSVQSFLNTSSIWDRIRVNGGYGYVNDGTVWTHQYDAIAPNC